MSQIDWSGAKAYVLERLKKELSPKLIYHRLEHTLNDVLPASERLAGLAGLNDAEALLLKTAALYHDIGFVEQYTQNEEIAVRIAAETLPNFGYTPDQIQRIGEVIMATRLPQNPQDFLGELICDADLDSLGRPDFIKTSHGLLHELQAHGAEITLVDWYQTQLDFLYNHRYFSKVARDLRRAGKQSNIQLLEKRLQELQQN